MIQVSLPDAGQQVFGVLMREVRSAGPLFEAGSSMGINIWVIPIPTQFLHDLTKRRLYLRRRNAVKLAAMPFLDVVNKPAFARFVDVAAP
jgi:hypothetical protein